jgi:hypothetical protein
MAADLGAGLFAWAQTVSTITDLLGADADIQLYPIAVLEQKTPPFAIYEEEKDTAVTTHNDAPTLASSRVSISCFGATPDDAGQLAEAFRGALTNFRGAMGDVTVQGVIYEGSSPAYQWEEQQFAVDVTFKFWYSL